MTRRPDRRLAARVSAAVSVLALAVLAGCAAASASSSDGSKPVDRPGMSAPERPAVVVRSAAPSPSVGRPTPGSSTASPPAAPAVVWPAEGEAAYEVGGRTAASPGQAPVPIASVAKLMTAYVVLTEAPPNLALTVTQADVDDTAARRARYQSVLTVQTGEVLTTEQALQGLLVPSANNIAHMLAVQVAGSEPAFVARMNAAARALGMSATTYTDPSGFDPGTVSTAADQLRLVEAAMRLPQLARIVAMPTATLPVAGVVRNNDALLGTDGFVGVKTGSTRAAYGCFAFRSVRPSGAVVTGVVLGQHGYDLIDAGLTAARRLVDQIR